jgi:hypothetical protein
VEVGGHDFGAVARCVLNDNSELMVAAPQRVVVDRERCCGTQRARLRTLEFVGIADLAE